LHNWFHFWLSPVAVAVVTFMWVAPRWREIETMGCKRCNQNNYG